MRYLRILCICIIQLFLSAVAFAQTQVTGHVADVRGEDIIGANVTVKGQLQTSMVILQSM